MARAEFGHAQGQIAIGLQRVVEDLYVGRAVHGLDREGFVLDLKGEHVLAEFLPVPGLLPEDAVVHFRRLHFLVA